VPGLCSVRSLEARPSAQHELHTNRNVRQEMRAPMILRPGADKAMVLVPRVAANAAISHSDKRDGLLQSQRQVSDIAVGLSVENPLESADSRLAATWRRRHASANHLVDLEAVHRSILAAVS
jgi:hypothetical protein